ncbi:MAG: hypothetical protein ACLFQ5_01020 [Oceanicaulis sp.]
MRLIEVSVSDGDRVQPLLKATLKTGLLDGTEDWRPVVLPVEASLPKIDESEAESERKQTRTLALHEEIYGDVAEGARVNSDFLLLIALSAIVVVFGPSADTVAAVIGAMVIAPLLGAIPAFSFAGALGDPALMGRAAKTAATGLAGVWLVLIAPLTALAGRFAVNAP